MYRHVGGTSCVNQHILNSEMKNKKMLFNCGNLHFRDSAIKKKYIYSGDGAPWTLLSILGHHGHVHGTPSMVLQHDDCYKCSFN